MEPSGLDGLIIGVHVPHHAKQIGPEKVLLVEDEDAHAVLVERNLTSVRNPRIDVERVSNLDLGLERLAQAPVDAVLLDMNLPDSRGIQTVERMVEAFPELPVIVLTSLDDEDVAVQSLRRGVEDYLVKRQLSSDLLSRSIRYAIERKRQRRELRNYAERLKRSNEELGEFAHVASHELKTPLWVIRHALQTIAQQAGDGLDEQATKMLGHAEEAVGQATDVINSLLAYARVSEPGSGVGPVSAEDALRDAETSLRPLIEQHDAVIECHELPMVRANGDPLVHLFRNLVENAIKYRAQEPPRIVVSAQSDGAQCRFRVADNGIGIEPQFVPRAFNMFERGSNHTEGTGIGLAICKRIVERLGGKIWFDPTVSTGAAVCFTLPLAAPGSKRPVRVSQDDAL